MPSPFPGMAPFLEMHEWSDFHARVNTVISDLLVPNIEPRYVVRVERRVYVEHPPDEANQQRLADVTVLVSSEDSIAGELSTAGALTAAPVECELPMPEERRETYLVIRERETMDVVTVLETLSPSNKRAGGNGRKEYLNECEALLESRSHLVELDLLRAGERLPTVGPLPAGDYYAIVSRQERRPRAEVYAWSMRQPLPTIPIPLKKGDPDVSLDLQIAFSTVYERARYDLSLDYHQPLTSPLTDSDADWLRNLIPAKQ